LPEDRIRYHICWGSWHGPHTTDLPLANIVDVLLQVHASAFSVEAGNVRHAHEWRVWQDVKLPDGKILIPGVVSHATNVVEHPELRSGGGARECHRRHRLRPRRIHPQLAWAKLEALVAGGQARKQRAAAIVAVNEALGGSTRSVKAIAPGRQD